MKTKKLLFGILITLALLIRGQAQSYLTNGLVAYYPLNGNANDASGNGNAGTIYNANFVTNPHGVTNGACQFYGNTNSYVGVTPTSSLNFTNEITVAFWCAVNGSGTQTPRLVSIDTVNGACEFLFTPAQQAFSFDYSPLNNWVPQSTWAGSFTNGQWLHLVGIATASGSQLYVNGVLVSTVTGLSVGNIGQTTAMNIGRMAHFGWDSFDGRMDEVRIYNRALSATDVQQLYAYEYAVEFKPIINLLKAVQPTFSNLIPGTNYQLQVSGDLNTWTNLGSAFTATTNNMTYPQYFNVNNWNQLFFRLQ